MKMKLLAAGTTAAFLAVAIIPDTAEARNRHRGNNNAAAAFALGAAIIGGAIIANQRPAYGRPMYYQQYPQYYQPQCRIKTVYRTDNWGQRQYDIYGRPIIARVRVCR